MTSDNVQQPPPEPKTAIRHQYTSLRTAILAMLDLSPDGDILADAIGHIDAELALWAELLANYGDGRQLHGGSVFALAQVCNRLRYQLLIVGELATGAFRETDQRKDGGSHGEQ